MQVSRINKLRFTRHSQRFTHYYEEKNIGRKLGPQSIQNILKIYNNMWVASLQSITIMLFLLCWLNQFAYELSVHFQEGTTTIVWILYLAIIVSTTSAKAQSDTYLLGEHNACYRSFLSDNFQSHKMFNTQLLILVHCGWMFTMLATEKKFSWRWNTYLHCGGSGSSPMSLSLDI